MRRQPATNPAPVALGAPPPSDELLVDPAELEDIELIVLTRMKEYAGGVHASVFHGEGFDFVGLREWQPGDRPSAIDWAQSTITNFSPLMARDFEHESTASIMIVADTSSSTRCGAGGTSIAKVIARAVATIGLAGAFFQDRVGLVTLNGTAARPSVIPRVGRAHAIHCLDAYQAAVFSSTAAPSSSTGESGLTGLLRRPTLVPVISDFLLDDPGPLLRELAQLGSVHDVFLAIVDSAFAFELPVPSTGWLEVQDAETGRTRLLSRREVGQLSDRARRWQAAVAREASRQGLDVVTLEPGREHAALTDFLGSRRRRSR